MTNRASIWDSPPRGSLSSPGGVSIQRTGCGDNIVIPVRVAGDGTVANLSTLNASQLDADGVIWVKDVPTISIYVSLFTMGTPGITSVSISPYFAMTRGGTKYKLSIPNVTADSGVVLQDTGVNYKLTAAIVTATNAVIFTFPNPGANWLAIYTSSIGTVTGSVLVFGVVRGWGVPQMLPEI